jgi:hypothetical protein
VLYVTAKKKPRSISSMAVTTAKRFGIRGLKSCADPIKIEGSTRDTIEHWDAITFNNPILNYIWQLLPGFILWQIWKERNKRIFHSKESTPELTWNRVASHQGNNLKQELASARQDM